MGELPLQYALEGCSHAASQSCRQIVSKAHFEVFEEGRSRFSMRKSSACRTSAMIVGRIAPIFNASRNHRGAIHYASWSAEPAAHFLHPLQCGIGALQPYAQRDAARRLEYLLNATMWPVAAWREAARTYSRSRRGAAVSICRAPKSPGAHWRSDSRLVWGWQKSREQSGEEACYQPIKVAHTSGMPAIQIGDDEPMCENEVFKDWGMLDTANAQGIS
jgi:hypothetical protein